MKSKIMTILCALLPTYCALFVKEGIASAGILALGSLIGVVASGIIEAEYRNDRELKDKLQLGWLLHIIGVFIVIAVKNIF